MNMLWMALLSIFLGVASGVVGDAFAGGDLRVIPEAGAMRAA